MVRTVADAIFERGLERGRAEGQQRLVLQLAHDGVIGGDQARDQLTRLHQDGTITHAQLARTLDELAQIDLPDSTA